MAAEQATRVASDRSRGHVHFVFCRVHSSSSDSAMMMTKNTTTTAEA